MSSRRMYHLLFQSSVLSFKSANSARALTHPFALSVLPPSSVVHLLMGFDGPSRARAPGLLACLPATVAVATTVFHGGPQL